MCEAAGPDITVFFTSDTRGGLRRCGCSEGQMGGLSARASYIKSNRVNGATLVLDAGDTLFDGPSEKRDMRAFYALKARTMLAALREAGTDAAAIGDYDLALGPDFLHEVAGGFPFIAANVKRNGRELEGVRPWVIKEAGGVRVAVISVLDNEFPYCDFPESYCEITVSDPLNAAKDAVRKLKGKADVFIILAHLSISDPAAFARNIPEAAVVIAGHSGEMLERPVETGGALLVKGFYRGKHMGRLDIWLGKAGSISRYEYHVIDLDESVPPDPKVEKIIAGYRRKLKGKKFAFDRPDPDGSSFVGASACRGCHGEAYSNWSATGHARAFGDLTKTDDQYDPECLGCHTVGYGFASGYRPGRDGMKGVACEDCHGRGSGHVKAGGASGMTRAVAEGVCRGCHDEYNSPNFEYESYKAKGGAHRGGQAQ